MNFLTKAINSLYYGMRNRFALRNEEPTPPPVLTDVVSECDLKWAKFQKRLAEVSSRT